MGTRAVQRADIERAAMRILYQAFLDTGWSVRELSERSGLPSTTAHDSVRGARAVTLSQYTALCKALNRVPSQVLRDAEAEVARVSNPDSTLDMRDTLDLAASRHPLEDEPDMP